MEPPTWVKLTLANRLLPMVFPVASGFRETPAQASLILLEATVLLFPLPPPLQLVSMYTAASSLLLMKLF